MLVRPGILAMPVTGVAPPSVTLSTVETGAGTDFIVTFSYQNLAVGATIRIVWAVTQTGTDSGIQNNAVSPQTIPAGGTVVTAIEGSVSVRMIASNGITILAQDDYSGPFTS